MVEWNVGRSEMLAETNDKVRWNLHYKLQVSINEWKKFNLISNVTGAIQNYQSTGSLIN